jgi:hypothetical protein
MSTVNNRIWKIGFSSLILGLGFWGIDILIDRAYRLDVIEATPLYSLPPHEYPKSNPVLGTLAPQQSIRVLRLRYGKDFQAFQVETKKGIVGWVISGKKLKVKAPSWIAVDY